MDIRNQIVTFLVKRSSKEYSTFVRILTTLAGATLVVAGIPAVIFLCGDYLYKASVLQPQFSLIISNICFVIGIPWMLSAVIWQVVRGKGTPVPVVPTKEFLQNGPYRYVRNPMMLGLFLYLSGWALLFNEAGAFLAAVFFIILNLAEVKIIEEPELEKRFGDAYREYKKEIPFIFPKWGGRK